VQVGDEALDDLVVGGDREAAGRVDRFRVEAVLRGELFLGDQVDAVGGRGRHLTLQQQVGFLDLGCCDQVVGLDRVCRARPVGVDRGEVEGERVHHAVEVHELHPGRLADDVDHVRLRQQPQAAVELEVGLRAFHEAVDLDRGARGALRRLEADLALAAEPAAAGRRPDARGRPRRRHVGIRRQVALAGHLEGFRVGHGRIRPGKPPRSPETVFRRRAVNCGDLRRKRPGADLARPAQIWWGRAVCRWRFAPGRVLFLLRSMSPTKGGRGANRGRPFSSGGASGRRSPFSLRSFWI
jgi:hypothetical protein